MLFRCRVSVGLAEKFGKFPQFQTYQGLRKAFADNSGWFTRETVKSICGAEGWLGHLKWPTLSLHLERLVEDGFLACQGTGKSRRYHLRGQRKIEAMKGVTKFDSQREVFESDLKSDEWRKRRSSNSQEMAVEGPERPCELDFWQSEGLVPLGGKKRTTAARKAVRGTFSVHLDELVSPKGLFKARMVSCSIKQMCYEDRAAIAKWNGVKEKAKKKGGPVKTTYRTKFGPETKKICPQGASDKLGHLKLANQINLSPEPGFYDILEGNPTELQRQIKTISIGLVSADKGSKVKHVCNDFNDLFLSENPIDGKVISFSRAKAAPEEPKKDTNTSLAAYGYAYSIMQTSVSVDYLSMLYGVAKSTMCNWLETAEEHGMLASTRQISVVSDGSLGLVDALNERNQRKDPKACRHLALEMTAKELRSLRKSGKAVVSVNERSVEGNRLDIYACESGKTFTVLELTKRYAVPVRIRNPFHFSNAIRPVTQA